MTYYKLEFVSEDALCSEVIIHTGHKRSQLLPKPVRDYAERLLQDWSEVHVSQVELATVGAKRRGSASSPLAVYRRKTGWEYNW